MLADYIKFLRTLDKKDKFKYYANTIKQYTKQWNQIRRKHITVSKTKKIAHWKKDSNYIFADISRYVVKNNKQRGWFLNH